MQQLLPGGLVGERGIRRDFSFRTLTGDLELALAESSVLGNLPDAVSCCLSAALEQIGGQSPDRELVEALCVGDRHFLMRCLDIHMGHDAGWYSTSCRQCHGDFDFYIELSSMPVKQAGEGYPYAIVPTAAGLCRFRVPNGADQSALAGIEDEQQSCTQLLRRCLLSAGEHVSPQEDVCFSPSELETIEQALELIAPELGSEVSVACVACGISNTVKLDPYTSMGKSLQKITGEVHQLAWYYHWSEREILSMPRQRRYQYLQMIDAARSISADVPSREM